MSAVEEEKCFLTKKHHDDHLQGFDIQIDDYQEGYQNAMIAFQRQLNLRNRDVIISKPQKKADENKASTSGVDKNTDNKQENENLGNGKQVIVYKIVANKEPRKDRISPQELPEQTMEKRKELTLAETASIPFSFESKVSKIKMSLPFTKICKNTEYRD